MPDPIHAPVEQYLQRVAEQLAGRPERERREILDALRRHIADALRGRSDHPTAEDVEAVLATMDAPEDYGDPPADTVSLAATRRRGDGRWFLLALAFLALNGWVAWRVTRPGAPAPGEQRLPGVVFEAGEGGAVSGRAVLRWQFDEEVAGTGEVGRATERIRIGLRPDTPGRLGWKDRRTLIFEPAAPWAACREFLAVTGAGWPGRTGEVFAFATAPLEVQEVARAAVDPERSVTLHVRFNAPPREDQLNRHVQVLDAAGRAMDFRIAGRVVSNSVLIETAPVLEGDRIRLRIRAGLPPRRRHTGPRGRSRV
jgi:hypothetical protein